MQGQGRLVALLTGLIALAQKTPASRSGSLSPGYRWFESISLQRRVCKLSVPYG